MMQVGIIAMAASNNYGAVLQSFALKNAINQFEGVHAEIINYRPDFLIEGYKPWLNFKIWRTEYKNFGFSYVKKKFIERWKLHKKFKKNYLEFEEFRKKYLGMKGKIYKEKNISEISDKYDIYITGSDQVWNPEVWNQGFDKNLFLSFTNNSHIRASYAASITIDLKEKYFDDFRTLIKNIDFISIREQQHEKLVENLSGKPVKTVLDPTFLIEPGQYEKIISEKTLEHEDFLLFYAFNKSDFAISYANKLASEEHLKILHFYYGGLKNRFTAEADCMYFAQPSEFLWYIKHAKYVLTDTFHGTAFCIIFQKQFLVFDSVREMSSRTTNILKIAELENRRSSPAIPKDIHDEIDWQAVSRKLEYEKAEAYEFLKKIFYSAQNTK